MGWHIGDWAKQFIWHHLGVEESLLVGLAGHTASVRYDSEGILVAELVAGGMEFGFLAAKAGLDVYWCRLHPKEGGRQHPLACFFACRGTDEIKRRAEELRSKLITVYAVDEGVRIALADDAMISDAVERLGMPTFEPPKP